MLRSVVDKTSKDPRTSVAIAKEFSGSYQEARSLYDNMIRDRLGDRDAEAGPPVAYVALRGVVLLACSVCCCAVPFHTVAPLHCRCVGV